MISFQTAKDLAQSAQITFNNMHADYEKYGVDWSAATIFAQTLALDNWDILYAGEVVGILRLSFDNHGCSLRDLQVNPEYQNKGIGAQALAEAKHLAIKSGAKKINLRVFKVSPAFHLYKRNGFTISHDDDKFYYMEQQIA